MFGDIRYILKHFDIYMDKIHGGMIISNQCMGELNHLFSFLMKDFKDALFSSCVNISNLENNSLITYNTGTCTFIFDRELISKA